MKRFFYGLMAASLLMAGCGGDDKAKQQAHGDDVESVEMTPEELAQAEEEAVRELARIISEEAADIPMAAGMGPDEFATDFDMDQLTEEEKMQLAAWEREAEEWANQEMGLAAEQDAPAVQFAQNSADIDANQREAIEESVAVAKAAIADGHELTIQGHASQLGDEQYNLELSEARAEALKQALVDNGVPQEKVHIAAYGESVPLQWTTADTQEAQAEALAVNQRAQLVVV